MQTFMNNLCAGIAVSVLAVAATPSILCASSFGDDAAFLEKHTPLIILSDRFRRGEDSDCSRVAGAGYD